MKCSQILVGLLSTLAVFGCSVKPDVAMPTLTPMVARNGEPRFRVARVGVFADDLAYGDRRGIYVIHDSLTEREYIGISGIGISEVGDHAVSNGKTTTYYPDER